MARALLFRSNICLKYWQEAIEASVYLYKITPHAYLKSSPLCRLYNKEPNTKNLKIWNSIAYYKDKTTSLIKLEPRAKLGILVGYNEYNYYILDCNEVSTVLRHVAYPLIAAKNQCLH